MITYFLLPVYLFLALMLGIAAYSVFGNPAQLKETLRTKAANVLGIAPGAREIQKPQDVFEPSPHALEAWERAGLIVEGVPPTIRNQHHLAGQVYLVQHPYLSSRKLVNAVHALVAQIPFYGARVEDKGGGVVEVTLMRQQVT